MTEERRQQSTMNEREEEAGEEAVLIPHQTKWILLVSNTNQIHVTFYLDTKHTLPCTLNGCASQFPPSALRTASSFVAERVYTV